jgi:hypothetical protein
MPLLKLNAQIAVRGCVECQHDDTRGVTIQPMHDASVREVILSPGHETVSLLGANARYREHGYGLVEGHDPLVAVQDLRETGGSFGMFRVPMHVWRVS